MEKTYFKDVKVYTQDGSQFVVEKQVCLMSGYLRELIEKTDEDQEEPEIRLANIKSSSMTKILIFYRHHVKEPVLKFDIPCEGDFSDQNIVTRWDQEFFDMEVEELIQLIQAVTFLKFDDIFELACFKVATMIRGKKPEEIRDILKIEDDLLDVEKKKLAEENIWLGK